MPSQVRVAFDPLTVGPAQATLTFDFTQTDGGRLNLSLSGTGISGAIGTETKTVEKDVTLAFLPEIRENEGTFLEM